MVNSVGVQRCSSDLITGMLREMLRQQNAVIETVTRDMQNFPRALFEDDELQTVRMSPFSVVKIFPLGDYRQINLDGIKGRTTLYFGNDGRLYEYGPQLVNHRDLRSPVMGNVIKLRALDVERLEYVELLSCRDLLRQVWLV